MKTELTSNSEQSIQSNLRMIYSIWKTYRFIKIKITTGLQRTNKQNSAMHVYFGMLAQALNQKGRKNAVIHIEYDVIFALYTKSVNHVDWTTKSVKDKLWRPVQIAMTGYYSTTKLKRPDVIAVFDEVNKKMIEMHGVGFSWPSIESMEEQKRLEEK